MMRMKLILTCFLMAIIHLPAQAQTVIAAAASLRQVWPNLEAAYGADTSLKVTFGSSGNLARQIAQGAPFELFLSANEDFVESLVAINKHSRAPEHYALGKLAWVAPAQGALAAWITNPQASSYPFTEAHQLAIPNPRFAPYGIAAKAVLNNLFGDNSQKIQLATAENASQALQFALSGATAGGIVPLSLLEGSDLGQKDTIRFAEISHELHDPIVHSMLLTTKATASAIDFFEFMLSAPAQDILAQHGFVRSH